MERTVPSDPRATATVRLAAGEVELSLAPDDGCRLTSLRVGGLELLSDGAAPTEHDGLGDNRFGWGCFLMAPWAGRIRDGTATWSGRARTLDRHGDPHALHGLVHDAAWAQVGDSSWRTHLDATDWFAPLDVTQQVVLAADHLRLDLEVHAPDTPAPATVGWHPWFLRRLTPDGPSVHVELPAAAMLARDDAGIATTREVPVPPGPWDDAFVGVHAPVRLTWPGQLQLAIDSDAPVTVVFTEPSTVVCVEPQSGPPDEVNLPTARVVTPEAPLRLSTTWRWRTL
jgi:aldose 1-epimerase